MMLKIQIALFLVLNLVNYLACKCIEESSAKEDVSEILEKSDLFVASALSSEGKADQMDASEQVTISTETGSREGSTDENLDFIDERAEFDDLSELIKTDTSLKEKSANEETTGERKAEELAKPNGESKSAESLKDESVIADKTGTQLEELLNISKSATEIEEKKAEDLSEASAESKISDNEMTFSPIHESDRTEAKSGELKEQPDELGLDGIIATRRMLSKPNATLDIKARSNEGISIVALEDKTAHDPTINVYNNNFEFGSASGKLINGAHVFSQNNGLKLPQTTTDTHVSLQSSPSETKNVGSQQRHQHQIIPQYYPQSKLHLDFPAFDVQQQEPRGIPIYLQLEQDQEKLKNNIIGTQIPRRCNMNCTPRQFYQSQTNLDSKRPLVLKQLINIDSKGRNHDQQIDLNHRSLNFNTATEKRNIENLYHNPINSNQQFEVQGNIHTKTPLEKKYFENLSLESKIKFPLFHQNLQISPSILPIGFKRSLDSTHLENFNHSPRNQDHLLQSPGKNALETKHFENLDREQRNRLQQFHQVQKIINPNIKSSENNALENFSHGKYTNTYFNIRLPKNPLINIMNGPATNYDLSSENLKTAVFQSLTEATGNPKKRENYLQDTNKQTSNPNLFNLNNVGSLPFDFSYLPRF